MTTRKLSDRTRLPMHHSEAGVVHLFCKVVFGSGAVGSYTASPGVTFARDDVGEYSLTFPPCANLLAIHATYVGAAAVDRVPQVESFDASTGDADINLLAVATPTDGVDADQMFITIVAQSTATR